MMSIYLVTLVTLQRYVSVSWPMLAKRFNNVSVARRFLAATLCGCFVYNFPRFIESYPAWDEAQDKYITIVPAWATKKSFTVGYRVGLCLLWVLQLKTGSYKLFPSLCKLG